MTDNSEHRDGIAR